MCMPHAALVISPEPSSYQIEGASSKDMLETGVGQAMRGALLVPTMRPAPVRMASKGRRSAFSRALGAGGLSRLPTRNSINACMIQAQRVMPERWGHPKDEIYLVPILLGI